ncbi:MAG: helix-hairpin-helix domain-containing protein [Pirellulaceae bacterium]
MVDGTGKFLANTTIFPTPPRSDTLAAGKTLLDLIKKYKVELIAIGNGTASRETDSFVADLIRGHDLQITKVMVSEAGASIYSASELAAKEFPDLDVTVRGAISIARRLQDPLAELVKSDPKSIGVGQYQHDVNQTQLRKCLDRVVESCVNSVGVDLNMASVPLLSYVAGIGPKLAESIVEYRNSNGGFKNRKQLAKVPKLGKKAFEQAAGFLRIRSGDEPLDNSAVHPESYPVVSRMAKKLQTDAKALVGNATLSQKLRPDEFVDGQFGMPTIVDIIAELGKPGRDPRSEFRAVQFDDNVNSMEDLKPGMVLEGVITNVTHFGAFIDIGVHQDALIHISQLANTFVKDPNEVVAVGDVSKVRVLEIDLPRKRISVTRKFP